MSNPICSLREKILTNNHVFQRGQNLVPLQIRDKIHDFFTKSETFSAQWPFTCAGNKLYLHEKRKSLLITNMNHNLGDSVAEGTVSEPKCHFQHRQDEIQ